jgi:hypothetical protein
MISQKNTHTLYNLCGCIKIQKRPVTLSENNPEILPGTEIIFEGYAGSTRAAAPRDTTVVMLLHVSPPPATASPLANKAHTGGDDLLLVFRKRELYHCIVFSGTKQNACGRRFVRQLLHTVVIVHIHLQLPDILVGKLSCFDLYDHKALQYPVLKYKVGKELIAFYMYALLPCHK